MTTTFPRVPRLDQSTSRLGRYALLFEPLSETLGFEAGDANLTRYVGNKVTQFVDPTGLYDDVPEGMVGVQEVKAKRFVGDNAPGYSMTLLLTFPESGTFAQVNFTTSSLAYIDQNGKKHTVNNRSSTAIDFFVNGGKATTRVLPEGTELILGPNQDTDTQSMSDVPVQRGKNTLCDYTTTTHITWYEIKDIKGAPTKKTGLLHLTGGTYPIDANAGASSDSKPQGSATIVKQMNSASYTYTWRGFPFFNGNLTTSWSNGNFYNKF